MKYVADSRSHKRKDKVYPTSCCVTSILTNLNSCDCRAMCSNRDKFLPS